MLCVSKSNANDDNKIYKEKKENEKKKKIEICVQIWI